MSDEELVAWLRKSFPWGRFIDIADRLEELHAENHKNSGNLEQWLLCEQENTRLRGELADLAAEYQELQG